jgi:hypothetical protein
MKMGKIYLNQSFMYCDPGQRTQRIYSSSLALWKGDSDASILRPVRCWFFIFSVFVQYHTNDSLEKVSVFNYPSSTQ